MDSAQRARVSYYSLLPVLQKSAAETNVDLWMLSRVSYAAKVCDEAMAQYDLTAATTACYNLWLYDLCDVYLVRK